MKNTHVTAENFWEKGKNFACDRTFFGNSNSQKNPKFFACDRGLSCVSLPKKCGQISLGLGGSLLLCSTAWAGLKSWLRTGQPQAPKICLLNLKMFHVQKRPCQHLCLSL